jgi:hypothetical protein
MAWKLSSFWMRESYYTCLLTTFNCFLLKGFREALSTRVVHTFFKRGDAFEFDNYKGITVGPILAKLFAMILDKRLSEWAKQHGLCAKAKTRFRTSYFTKKLTKYECVCFARMWIHMDWKEYMQYDKTSITHGIKVPMVSPLTSS